MNSINITIPRILVREHALEARVREVLIGCFVCAVLGYIYLVGASALHVIARKDADMAATRLQSSIAALEHDYFIAAQVVSRDTAATRGLVAIEDKVYVPRTVQYALATNHEI